MKSVAIKTSDSTLIGFSFSLQLQVVASFS
jgi:hypothetical protein